MRLVETLILVPLVLLAALILFCWWLAMASGWRRLAGSYTNDTPFEASEWRFAQATVRRSVLLTSNLVVWVGADRQFLYLRTWPFNLPGFRELRVPWTDVSIQERKVFLWKICDLRFKRHPEVLIQLADNVMRLTLGDAGQFSSGLPDLGSNKKHLDGFGAR